MKQKLIKLIEEYKKSICNVDRNKISEETIRTWINEFLKIFGWDVKNINYVLQENSFKSSEIKTRLEQIGSKHNKPDYTIVNGENIKTFIDAKKLNVNIFNDKEVAFQIRSYGWSAKVPCAFVSNFEQLVIYDCSFVPNPSQSADIGTLKFTMDEYVENFDKLYEFLNFENVISNHLNELYKTERIEGTKSLDSNFMNVLSDFRIKLAQSLYESNKNINLSNSQLNYYTQVILDRIIFIRICESKGIEKNEKLKEFLKEDFWKLFKNSCYMEFYNHYDGAMFDNTDDLMKKINIDNGIFNEFINKLYYPYPYKFDVMPIKVIANIYEEFLSKQLLIENDIVIEKIKSEYIKQNGAIPTPEYLVDKICKETIEIKDKKCIDDILNVKILDPACGSGVFLVSCFELLSKKVEEFAEDFVIEYKGIRNLTTEIRRKIITNCLYGIDYDEAAVEVTKMSLALKVIDFREQEQLEKLGAFGSKILRDIQKNIKLGNSLVGTDNSFPVEEIEKIKPLNIKEITFKEIFESKGGFDYIVGNPPYVETKYYKEALPLMHHYLSKKYQSFEGKADLAVLFIERSMQLLNENGKLGYIVQKRWFKTKYGEKIRNIIESEKNLNKIIDFSSTNIFEGRTTYVAIIVLSKKKNKSIEYIKIHDEPLKIKTLFENNIKLDKDYISYEMFNKNGWNMDNFELQAIKQKLVERYGTIKDIERIKIKDGIQALWKKIYHITDYEIDEDYIIGKNGFNETVKIEKSIVKPVIYNQEFYAFKKIKPSAFCIFPYKGEKNKDKISLDEIKSKYPLAYKYLMDNEKRIKENVNCNVDNQYWHTFTREHNHEMFLDNKIILPMTAKDTFATYITDFPVYMDNSNVWFITIDKATEKLMKAVTCIINSTIFSTLAKCGANPQRGGYYKFNKQFIEPVPLPINNLKNRECDEFEKVYDKLIVLQNKYIEASSNQKIYLYDALKKEWDRLDELSEKIYDLEYEDKKVLSMCQRSEDRIKILKEG